MEYCTMPCHLACAHHEKSKCQPHCKVFGISLFYTTPLQLKELPWKEKLLKYKDTKVLYRTLLVFLLFVECCVSLADSNIKGALSPIFTASFLLKILYWCGEKKFHHVWHLVANGRQGKIMLKELAIKLLKTDSSIFWFRGIIWCYALVAPRTLGFTIEETQYLCGYAEQSTTESLWKHHCMTALRD